MKIFRLLPLLLAIVASTTFAATPTIPFSPYADITINVHWDSTTNDLEPQDLTAISAQSSVSNYHLAFITDAGSCDAAWGAQSSYSTKKAWGSHLTDKMRTNKIAYTISLGGATGNDLSQACSDSQLIDTYEQIIKTYQPEGLDFDIENSTANVHKIMLALKTVQKSHPNLKLSFTLPVLPEGLTAEGESIVRQAEEQQLTYHVNIMAMDYGPAYANDMGQYAIEAATNLENYLAKLYPEKSSATRWEMVEVTPMIGINDVQVERFTLNNVDTLRNFAKQNRIGGLAMWSVGRDYPCDAESASPVCSGKQMQTKAYEFAERFNQ